jgi:hypothetical protein
MYSTINLLEEVDFSKRTYGSIIRDRLRHIMDRNVHSGDLGRPRAGMFFPLTGEERKALRAVGAQVAEALREEDLDSLLDILNGKDMLTRLASGSNRLHEIARNMGGCECGVCEDMVNLDEMVYSRYSDIHVCESCQDGFVYSEVMEDYIPADVAMRFYRSLTAYNHGNHDWVTQDYAESEDLFRHGGDWFSESAAESLGLMDSDDDSDDSDYGPIRNYHSGYEIGHIPSEYDKRKPRVLLGLELEVEVNEERDRYDLARECLNTLGTDYIKCEADGSLDHGFEMITGFTGLDVHAKRMAKLQAMPGRKYLRSHDTGTCGLHVHVCKAGMTPMHAAKLVEFIHSKANQPLIQAVARRYERDSREGYAYFKSGRTVKAAANQCISAVRWYKSVHDKQAKPAKSWLLNRAAPDDRYEALNFTNDKTVEFRMFRGTTRFETIMACLEFAFACWHFTAQAGLKELDEAHFMAFICAKQNRCDTKYLRKYYNEKGFASLQQAESKIARKFKAIGRNTVEVEELNEEAGLPQVQEVTPLQATGTTDAPCAPRLGTGFISVQTGFTSMPTIRWVDDFGYREGRPSFVDMPAQPSDE